MIEKTPALNTRLEKHRLGDLRLLKSGRNARFMRHEQFQMLVDNLKNDGVLTSVPFGAYDEPGKPPVILSGNHRVKAALEAFGPDTEIDVMVTDTELDSQRSLAIQLSHNAIAGEDDPAVLAALYEEMDDIDWRSYSGLDDKMLDLLVEIDTGSINEANLDFQTLTMMFFPEELERAKNCVDEALTLSKGADEQWAAPFSQYERLLDAIDVTQGTHGIKNVATAFGLILDLFELHMGELADGWYDSEELEARRNDWIPLASITGWTAPTESAAVIKQALDKVMGSGEIKHAFLALEMICAEYLAGA
jgi:hypothetical protein